MGHTDSNGIAFLDDTDPVDVLHTTVNQVPSSVSAWISSRVHIRRAANSSARTALETQFPPTPSAPLYVHQDDTGVLWSNIGSGWVPVMFVSDTRFTPQYRAASDTARNAILTSYGATADLPLRVEQVGASNAKRGVIEVSRGGDWMTENVARTRVLAPNLSGPISTNNLVADQTIPANTVPTASYELIVSTSIQSVIAAGGGVTLEVMVDNNAVKSATFGNGASGAQNMALTIDYVGTLDATVAHTVRARVVNVVGSNTVQSGLGQTFSMSVRPALAL